MKKGGFLLLILVVPLILFLLFTPETVPNNLQFRNLLESASDDDVIIVFNSGGWGNTPLEKAFDFAPIVKGAQESLNEWGFNSIIIPYQRTKDNFLGKITSVKEMPNSFSKEAEKLAKEIEEFLNENPGKKIIVAGLSNGATFVEETMKKISNNVKNQVFALEAGVPFWKKKSSSENILRLDNNGKDALSAGKIKDLLSVFLKAPFKWVSAKVSGKNLTFSQALYFPGHEYSWPDIKKDVVSFLESRIK